MIGLTGIDALEAEMRDRLAEKNKIIAERDETIRSLRSRVEELERNMADVLHIADDPEHSEYYDESMPRWRIRRIALNSFPETTK